jgi:hypothetical protein
MLATQGLSQQNQQLIAQIVSIIGMVAATLGWAPADKIQGITTNILAGIGPIATAVGLIWSLFASRKNAIVSEVAAMPEVRAVVTEPTHEGRELANSSATPSNVVVARPEGSPVPAAPPHP